MNNLANSDQTSELVKFFFLSNCACTHQGAVIGALEHLRLDSCLLKCVYKLKGCQDIYLQALLTHPSNMTHPVTHPYIETVVVLCGFVHLFSVCIP